MIGFFTGMIVGVLVTIGAAYAALLYALIAWEWRG